MKELSEKDVAPPTLYPSRKEEFLNSLKVDITNKEQDPFPSDEDISKKWILVISFIVLTWMILIKDKDSKANQKWRAVIFIS